jgi:hypothetical protein
LQNPYKDFSHVNPQPNEHFRQIENSVFWVLVNAGFSGPEYQLILCVIDKTWGYGKTSDAIPLSQFEKATGLERRNIAHYLTKLEASRVLIIQRGSAGRGNMSTYMFNKYWDTWKIEKVLAIPLLLSNGVSGTLLPEKLSGEHQSDSNSVPGTPLVNGVQDTPLGNGKGVISAGKGVADAQGKGVQDTPSKESIKKFFQKKESLMHDAEFQKYLAELTAQFKDLNFKDQMERFWLWWEGEKRELKKPKLAVFNWMTKARKINGAGETRGEGDGTRQESRPTAKSVRPAADQRFATQGTPREAYRAEAKRLRGDK